MYTRRHDRCDSTMVSGIKCFRCGLQSASSATANRPALTSRPDESAPENHLLAPLRRENIVQTITAPFARALAAGTLVKLCCRANWQTRGAIRWLSFPKPGESRQAEGGRATDDNKIVRLFRGLLQSTRSARLHIAQEASRAAPWASPFPRYRLRRTIAPAMHGGAHCGRKSGDA
jgi:hypothetical protein